MSFTLIPRTRVIFRWATQASRSAVAHNAFASLISRSSTASPARATLAALQRCGYATATATKRATKPRATAAKRTATTGRKTASGKTVAKRAPAKKTKTAAKKSVAKKPVRKAKKVAKKPVKPKKKVLTERQKELLAKKKLRDEVAELKVKALTPPEKLPDTNMSLYVKEHVNGTNDFKKAAQQYKDLPEHQVQDLSRRAAANKRANAEAYKRWIETLTPLQVKDANQARRRLNTLLKKQAYRPLHDDRLVTRPRSGYVLFFKDHFAAQAQPEDKAATVAGRIGMMWRNLGAAEKEKYTSLAQQDRARYINEYKHLYGEEPRVLRATA
ncbi:High mobility group, superfamily [Ascosphaera apis ARSEF 7405]|uniref:High mobility group, superfamily n=1 Tax=Ascosphaera apis ARSEF 7405 TaxID=392613 RepID=A0A162I3F5_9EURO|nr:High mobility group, superfamily [Ascosphaera apis ARSEF 7405]